MAEELPPVSPSVGDAPEVSEAAILLEKYREQFEVEHLLEEKTKEYQERMRAAQVAEDALAQRRADMDDSVRRCQRYCTENAQKIAEAEARRDSENQEIMDIDREIEIYDMQIQEQRDLADRQSKELAALTKYEAYLESVVAESDDTLMNTVSDLLSRYQSLVNARNDLQKQERVLLRESESCDSDASVRTQENSTAILKLSTEIARIKEDTDDAGAQIATLNQIYQSSLAQQQKDRLFAASLSLVIRTLYDTSAAGTKVARRPTPPRRAADQLQFVAEYLCDLKKIIELWKLADPSHPTPPVRNRSQERPAWRPDVRRQTHIVERLTREEAEQPRRRVSLPNIKKQPS